MRSEPRQIRPNFLAGPYLDRRGETREEPDWQQIARADANTCFVLSRGTALGFEADGLRVAFVDHRHELVSRANDDALILLGWFRERRCVLVQLDDEIAEPGGMRFEELRPLASELDADEASLMAYARALIHWQRRHRHCGVCGAKTLPERGGHVMRCSAVQCDSQFFPRIDPAIIVLVTDGQRALLGRQASWPPRRYSTIAGFVEPGESLEDTVRREVLEETGVTVDRCHYHSSQPWPFPSSLMLGFIASAAAGALPRASDELEDARWFTREQIEAGEILLPPATSISHRLIMTWLAPDSAD